MYKLRRYVAPTCSESKLESDFQQLRRDLLTAIGPPDGSNIYQSERIQHYCDLSHHEVYGGAPLSCFDERLWFEQAIHHTVRGVSDEKAILAKFDPFKDEYVWKENYLQSHWYQFQEAAKEQQSNAWAILQKRVFHGMALENF